MKISFIVKILKKISIILSLCFSSFTFSKQVVLYIDHATLPTLQQLLHFVETKNLDTAYGFSFDRVSLSSEIFEDMKDIYIEDIKRKDAKYFESFLKELSNKYQESLEIEVHTNLFLSISYLKELIRLSQENNNILIKKIHFYDDGSIEYQKLESFREMEIENILKEQKDILSNFISNHEISGTSNDLMRYTLASQYPSEYHFLHSDYIQTEEFLQPLVRFLEENNAILKQFDYSKFNSLDEEQKEFYLSLLKVDKEFIKNFNPDENNIVFIGTNSRAFLNDDMDKATYYQIELIRKYLDPSSAFYIGNGAKLFFKGHPAPHAQEINNKIEKEFPNIVVIPPHIPFETLLMLGADIDEVTGMSSSIFFTFPKDKLGKIFFTDKQGKTIVDVRNTDLAKVFKVICKLSDEQIQKIEDVVTH